MNEDAFFVQDIAREVMVPIVPHKWCDDAYDRNRVVNYQAEASIIVAQKQRDIFEIPIPKSRRYGICFSLKKSVGKITKNL